MIPILLLILIAVIPGCTTSQNANLTAGELRTTFLDNAGKIQDYHSVYNLTRMNARISFDWKSPGFYRMEYLESENPLPGTLFFINRTMAIDYDPGPNEYQIRPGSKYLRDYDYQNMVQRIVKDGRFSIIDKNTNTGKTFYEIEVVTEPWSMDYTSYTSSRIRAWVDPSTGLADNISIYYPSDTLSHSIRYDRIDVNTNIPESHFMFSPPPRSSPRCGSGSGISDAEYYDAQNISPALLPGCHDCTDTLLELPVGGFKGDPLLISLWDYNVSGNILKADPHRAINYTFYSRSMNPGKVRYTVSRVAGLYRMDALPMPDFVSITIDPEEFNAEPGREYTSEMMVHVKPGTVYRENFWIHIHADVEGEPDAVTDDWIRMAIDDGSEMSGMGLYHFYRSGGGYCQNVLVIRQGESGHARFAVRTSERDTGPATLKLLTVPCDINHGPVRSDERPAWPEGIHALISPQNFTVRSFASYMPDMAFTVDPDVKTGDYCFSTGTRIPTGGSEYSAFMVRVVP